MSKSECHFFHEIDKQGNGLRGVDYNAHMDLKRSCGFDDSDRREGLPSSYCNPPQQHLTEKFSKVISYMVKQHQIEFKEERDVQVL